MVLIKAIRPKEFAPYNLGLRCGADAVLPRDPPGVENTIRGYAAASLVVIDEASRVPDEVYHSVRPMLAVSAGRLVCMSTPAGRRGWFYDAWENGKDWHKVKILASQCPRISPRFWRRSGAASARRCTPKSTNAPSPTPKTASFSAASSSQSSTRASSRYSPRRNNVG